MKKRKKWTQAEDDYLRKIYPEMSNEEVAMWLHRSKRAVMAHAYILGVHKSPEFAEKQFRKGQFRKGQTPHNKGKSRKYWATPEAEELMTKGQFKPGECRDDNPRKKPIGHEKVYADGYVWIITEHGRKQKHRVVWEQANGPVPPNHCIKFKDGDRTNCSLDNLYLVTRAENCRMVTASLSTEQRKARIEKIQAKRNQRIRRDRIRLKWGLEPETKLIKRV